MPPHLPPEPAMDILGLLPLVSWLPLISSAGRAVGRLDEAVLSSQIEGTQSTLSDLLRFEPEVEGGRPIDDISRGVEWR